MSSRRGWTSLLLGYGACAVGSIGVVVACAWPLLDVEGRNGLLLAAGVVLATQTVAFAALAAAPAGTNRFMGTWLGGTLLRIGTIGGVGLALDGRAGVDPAVALPTMAGLMFALMLLEPATLRWGRDEQENRDGRTSHG